MTSARRRKKIAALKKSKTKKGFSFRKLLIPLVIVLVGWVFIWATSRTFAKNSKVTVVEGRASQVYVSTFDRGGGRITNLLLPRNTQVNVARQLGTWPIISIWRLGENEKLGGTLLAETIIKNFKIPVTAWADERYLALSRAKTNLGVGDRLRLALFSLTVSPSRRSNIDLSETGFLRKTKLVGGEEGYLISEKLPQSLYYIFSDDEINSANLRIEIQNFSERKGGSETLVAVLEVMGAKTSAITKKESKDFLCEVAGRDRKIAEKIAKIFGCRLYSRTDGDNFDLTIKVGEEFAKRY